MILWCYMSEPLCAGNDCMGLAGGLGGRVFQDAGNMLLYLGSIYISAFTL